MKTKLLLLLATLIFNLQYSHAWRIDGPRSVCPGQVATYKFYTEMNVAYFCQGTGKATIGGTAIETETYGDQLVGQTQAPIVFPVEITVQWPFTPGNGNVEFFAKTCTSLHGDLSGSIMVSVGTYPSLSLSTSRLCSSTGSVTVTASNSCTSVFDWQAPTGWIFTNNNSNVLKNGPNVVTVKPTASAFAGSFNVSAFAVYPNGTRSNGAYANILYYPVAPPTVLIEGTAEVCTSAPNQNYSFYDNNPDVTKRWTIAYNPSPKATIVSSNTGGSVSVDIVNSATAGMFDLNLELTNVCGLTSVSTKRVFVDDKVQAAPGSISGPAAGCNNGTSYSFSLGYMASGVSYDIQPAGAAASSSVGPYGVLIVVWNSSFTGTAAIRAHLKNGCGFSEWSPVKNVSVTKCRLDELAAENESSAEEWSASVYPNPAGESASLQIKGAFGGNGSVQVLDSRGSVVYTSENISAGSDLVFGADFTPGLYTVKVSYGNTHKNLKFVKE